MSWSMRSSLRMREGGEPYASGCLINRCQNTFETGGDGGDGDRREESTQTCSAEDWETLDLFYYRYFVQLSKERKKTPPQIWFFVYDLVNTKNADDASTCLEVEEATTACYWPGTRNPLWHPRGLSMVLHVLVHTSKKSKCIWRSHDYFLRSNYLLQNHTSH